LKPDDDKPGPETRGTRRSSERSSERGAPSRGVDVEWTEEERRLLAELRKGAGAETTEAIRRLVLGILAQVQGRPEEKRPGARGAADARREKD